MGLFNTPFEYDDKLLEATVTSVDPIRFTCTVQTVRGQFLQEVPWLLPTGGTGKNGMHVCPSVGDQVVVSTALSYPVILGSLPRLGTPSTILTNVSGTTIDIDTGNNTNMRNGFIGNPNKPSDFVPGDHVITTEGGGIFAMLVNGSSLLKASALAHIFLSRFDDLVRVVARNWERFSDVGQNTAANVKGRMYEFFGWDRKLEKSKLGVYELKDVIGDVAAGEVLLGEPSPEIIVPVADNRVRKYWLQDANNNDLMVEVLQEEGKITVTVQDVPQTTKAVKQQDKNLFDVKVQDPTKYSQITINPTNIVVDHNNVSTAVFNSSSITIDHNEVSTVTLTGTSITLDHDDSSTVVLDGSGIRSDHGGHFVHIDSSGVHMG